MKEPVTESTKKAARCFYALSQSRADKKRYPAVDPIDSYSKYLEYPEIIGDLSSRVNKDWVDKVLKGKNIVLRGKEAFEQINILGDDGVPIEYHRKFWKSELIDFIILQQDAFDKIDSVTSLERQEFMYSLIIDICDKDFEFDDFEECANFYKKLINILRQMNYSEFKGDNFNKYLEQLKEEINNGR